MSSSDNLYIITTERYGAQRHWLMAYHPNRALRIIEHHARSQGRRFRRTV